MKKEDLDTLEIKEIDVEDMDKAQLINLIESQKKALRHAEHERKQSDELIKSMRKNFVDLQKDTQEDFETMRDRTMNVITAFHLQKRGMVKVLEGLIDLATWDDILNDIKENENKEEK